MGALLLLWCACVQTPIRTDAAVQEKIHGPSAQSVTRRRRRARKWDRGLSTASLSRIEPRVMTTSQQGQWHACCCMHVWRARAPEGRGMRRPAGDEQPNSDPIIRGTCCTSRTPPMPRVQKNNASATPYPPMGYVRRRGVAQRRWLRFPNVARRAGASAGVGHVQSA